MEAIKEKNKTEIDEKELRKITEAYRKLNPTNRYFLTSASSMLLASQETSVETEREKEVV